MSNVIKIALAIALLIFIAGIVWAVIAARRTNEPVVQTPPPVQNTPTPPATQSPVTTPDQGTATPTPTESKGNTTKRPQTRQVIIIEEVPAETGASAWASAGVNPDGSTWAESHAE